MSSLGLNPLGPVKIIWICSKQGCLEFFLICVFHVCDVWPVLFLCCPCSNLLVELFENFQLARSDVDVWPDLGDGSYSLLWTPVVHLNQICCHHSGTPGAPSLTMHIDRLALLLVLESKLDSFLEVSQGWNSSHVYCAKPQLLDSYVPPFLEPGPPA